VGAGVSLVGAAGETLQRIAGQVGAISSVITEIAASAQEQAAGLSQVNTAVNQMDQGTQHTTAMASRSASSSQSLLDEVRGLAELVQRFRVGGGASQGVRRAA
jgi:methyl-accepting chemotaxis protein